ncbi:MAG: serine/threonine protein kinase [Labilithrix sp.]|nr:serine/threonine protein kinase [Labilithrix sp.]
MVDFDVMAANEVEDWVPRPGTVIDNRYQLEAVVGNGTMGAVVAARHLALDRRVAIKFLRPERAGDPTALDRFLQEASAASRIRSDHVVRVHDVGATERGIPFMAMELLDGIDLEKLAARGPLSIQLAADCVLQAAEALAEAHVAGIIHRDIKPSNLFLTQRPDGSLLVKVLDFGISKLAPERGGDPSLTATQAVIGSPAYMAPEQIRTSKYVTGKVDVWALGVVLFEILTTRLPFDGDTVGSVLAAVTMLPPAPLRALRPDAPERVEAAVLACLEKDPAARATLGDLAVLLRPFASPVGVVSADRVARICGAPVAGFHASQSMAPAPPSVLPPPPLGPAAGTAPARPQHLGIFLVGAGLLALLVMTVVVALPRRAAAPARRRAFGRGRPRAGARAPEPLGVGAGRRDGDDDRGAAGERPGAAGAPPSADAPQAAPLRARGSGQAERGRRGAGALSARGQRRCE